MHILEQLSRLFKLFVFHYIKTVVEELLLLVVAICLCLFFSVSVYTVVLRFFFASRNCSFMAEALDQHYTKSWVFEQSHWNPLLPEDWVTPCHEKLKLSPNGPNLTEWTEVVDTDLKQNLDISAQPHAEGSWEGQVPLYLCKKHWIKSEVLLRLSLTEAQADQAGSLLWSLEI